MHKNWVGKKPISGSVLLFLFVNNKFLFFELKKAKEDLKSFSISNDLCDFASSIQKDALKKKFILARGIELFPSDSNVLQNFADFLAERDDVNNSWEFANKLYLQGISSASKKLKEDPSAKATLRTVYITNLYRYVYFCANNKKKLKTAHKYFRVLLKELPGKKKKNQILTIKFKRKKN